VFAGFDEEAGRALERGARILGDDPYGERETLILEAADGFMRERVRRRNPKPRHATDLTDLRPDDIVTVYHGTRLSEAPALINGFDANKIQYRHYGGPRHAGLFVTPDFEVGRRFSDYGQLVFELHVPAKYLHGTDFSGNIQRIGDKDAATQRFYRGKYPKSFRPLLSDSMTDRGTEPQALLRGLVSPKQIARVYHTPEPHGDGTWYTREAFLNLGLEVTPPYGRPELLRDVEVDLSSPSMDYDAFVDAMASMLEVDRAKVTKALSWRAKQSTDKLQQIIESVGFGPTAARTYARRFGDQLQREANPGDITDLDKVRREKLREQRAEEKREVEAQIEQAMASIPEEELESPKERKARKKAERARARKERRAKKRGPHLKVVENPEQPKAAAGVLLVAADTGRVLLGLRSPEVRTPGVWSIIGGGVDEGETPKQAAVRELDEEVGYSGKIQRWKKGPTLGSDTMPFFTYVGFVRHEFTPMINWEHTDAAWFDPNDLPEPLHPTLKAFIEDRS
jgi:8-oxo-dGTP pyrophosphatase MutT (NUDIX family)